MLSFLRRIFHKQSPVRKLWYLLKGVSAAWWYGFPAKKLTMIGITGTDGKTTTTEMVSHILEAAHIRHLHISTDSIFLNGKREKNETKRTTLSPWQTQKLLKRAVCCCATHAVLEVSSHALDQFRLWGVHFDAVGITNISEEHLEDHGGFQKYAAAKKKLFTRYAKSQAQAVLNADNETIASWDSDITIQKHWFSTAGKNLEYSAHSLQMLEQGIAFLLNGDMVQLKLFGGFNMQNATVAFALAQILAIPKSTILTALSEFTGVLGRLQKIDTNLGFTAYIDDAVTENAFAAGLTSLRARSSGKVWVVFGLAGGGRDKCSRPKIGKTCGELADYVILTDDEPHTESPEAIRDQIKTGLKETKVWNTEYFQEIPERRAAITYAVEHAKAGDSILIPGLGSYATRSIGGKEVPWSDRGIVEEVVKRIS